MLNVQRDHGPQVRLEVLKAALETVEYKIKHLEPYYSYLQKRAWRADRKRIKREIKLLKKIIANRKKSRPFRAFWYDNI